MDVNQVAIELTERIKLVAPDAYVHPNPPEALQPPCFIVSYPAQIDYDETYGRGMDKIIGWEIVGVAGGVSLHTTRKTLLAWASGGLGGVKGVLETGTYASFDEIQVTQATFDVFDMAGVQYMSATWLVNIWGTGRA